MTVKERLRALLAALIEEVPDECPTKAPAEIALETGRTSVKRLRELLTYLAEEAPDVCPTKSVAESFLGAGAMVRIGPIAEANTNAATPLGIPYAPHGPCGTRICPLCGRKVRDYPKHYAEKHAEHAAEERQALAAVKLDPRLVAIAAGMMAEGIRPQHVPAFAGSKVRSAKPERVLFGWAGTGFGAWVALDDDGPAIYTTSLLARLDNAKELLSRVEAILALRGLRKAPSGRRWTVVLGGQRYEVVEHPSFGLRVERENGAAVWTGKLLPSGDFEVSSSTLRPGKRHTLLQLIRDGDPLHRGQLQTREEHLRDLGDRVDDKESGTTEAVAELLARDFAAQVIVVAHWGPTPVTPRPRPGGYGLYGITSKTWIAIRPDGWPVLAPGPEGSVATWPTKAAVQEAIDAAKRRERSR
jgi:hypothetical protein